MRLITCCTMSARWVCGYLCAFALGCAAAGDGTGPGRTGGSAGTVNGGAGNDTLNGLGGADSLDGGIGDDVVAAESALIGAILEDVCVGQRCRRVSDEARVLVY